MKTKVLFTILLLALTANIKAAYKYSVQSGSWGLASTWSGGSVPPCGDSIVISASHTVTVYNQLTYNCSSKMSIVVKGVLNFDGGNKLSMPCDSRVYIMGGGKVTSDGGGNSNRIEICGDVLWSASVGTLNGPSCLPTTLPGCSLVMPIELLGFNVSQCGTDVCINWSTATEKDNDYVIVQKLSGDVFVDVVRVDSKGLNGNSRTKLAYSAKDETPSSGTQYYRLKQVDMDGTFSTSKIVVIDYKAVDATTEIYPNPSSGTFNVRSNGDVSAALKILDCSGNVIRNESYIGSEIQVSGLQKGFYYCVITTAEKTEIMKVVVQ